MNPSLSIPWRLFHQVTLPHRISFCWDDWLWSCGNGLFARDCIMLTFVLWGSLDPFWVNCALSRWQAWINRLYWRPDLMRKLILFGKSHANINKLKWYHWSSYQSGLQSANARQRMPSRGRLQSTMKHKSHFDQRRPYALMLSIQF